MQTRRTPLPSWLAQILRCAALLLALAGAVSSARADEPPRDAAGLLDEAYRRKAAHDPEGAAAAFAAARAAGADAQLVSLELAYLAMAKGDVARARTEFEAAARGPDRARAKNAQAELRFLPKRFWVDVYADAYGWKRLYGATLSGDVVPTLRLRALVRPVLSLDLDFYAFFQATRDLASHGSGTAGLPVIYADDYALTGVGVMLRVLQRRLGFFLQGGPAFDLLDDGKSRVALDVRGGAFVGAETAGCAPAPAAPARWGFLPCAEIYAEGVYVSRFDNNVVAFARPRVAASYLVTGPVAWQLFAEARVAKDKNDDFYNNFVDAGAGHRLRLLRPLRVDLLFGIHAGTYFGLQNRDPAPRPLEYLDFRVQAATYVEL